VDHRLIFERLSPTQDQLQGLAWEDDVQRDNREAVRRFESGDLPDMPISACAEAEGSAAEFSARQERMAVPVHTTAAEQNQALLEWCEAHGQPDIKQVPNTLDTRVPNQCKRCRWS
jgi:hypothetical protein